MMTASWSCLWLLMWLLHLQSGPTCRACSIGHYGADCIPCANRTKESIGENITNSECPQNCSVGKQGISCEGMCASGCLDSCDRWNGICHQCKRGRHGLLCNESCHINCLECNQTNAKCIACNMTKTYGPSCQDKCEQCDAEGCNISGFCVKGCIAGWFGDKCEQNCSTCFNMICNESRNCTEGCEDGKYWGNKCNKRCPTKCKKCEQSTGYCTECLDSYYGHNCSLQCSNKCKSNKKTNMTTCSKQTGDCSNGCVDGWFFNNCSAQCGENCINNSCFIKFGKCKEGCKPGWYGIHCNVSCVNCANNTCNRKGHCICNPGRYGEHCFKDCPSKCKNHTCKQTTGVCSNGCTTGYYGDLCQLHCSGNCKKEMCLQGNGTCRHGCKVGYFRNNCSQQCSKNCNDSVCNLDTGICPKGCALGWYGNYCNMSCSTCTDDSCHQNNGTCLLGCRPGLYGPTCQTNCSGNCKGNYSLNQFLVHCEQDNGKCKDGCVQKKYGDKCNKNCSIHCVGGICEQASGYCGEGCNVGWYGRNCTERCSDMCGLSKNNATQCNQTTGDCLNGCRIGRFGPNCTSKCNSGCLGKVCEMMSGECGKGCISGWTGTFCKTKCKSGKYGKNCEKSCIKRHCSRSSQTCNHRTGQCGSGCLAGYQGTDCRAKCKSGKYGKNCEKSCIKRHCSRSSQTCNHRTGQCGSGCLAGYQGTDCRDKCKSGKYGKNCEKSCIKRHCSRSSQTCNHTTGQCESGCLAGYQGTDCRDRCKSGKNGKNCEKSCIKRHCSRSSQTCNHTTGQCESGCLAGYQGTDCRDRCKSGKYGKNCEKSCIKRHCSRSSQTCNHTTGQCGSGCLAGYQGTDCRARCKSGKYGKNCEKSCIKRHCSRSSQTCNHTTGQCGSGCLAGYQGTDCRATCSDGYYGKNCLQLCSERQCSDSNGLHCNKIEGECTNGCKPGWQGIDCKQECSADHYGEYCLKLCSARNCHGDQGCHHETGRCVDGCISGWEETSCDKRKYKNTQSVLSTGIIAGLVVVIILVIILVVIVFMIVFGRRRMTKRQQSDTTRYNSWVALKNIRIPKTLNKDERTYVNAAATRRTPKEMGISKEVMPVDNFVMKPIVHAGALDWEEEEEEAMGSVYCNLPDRPRGGVVVNKLAGVIEQIRTQDGGFGTEFKNLRNEFLFPYDASQMTENRTKNRYVGYYPYDQNRVMLSVVPGVPHSDYINASYLDGYTVKNNYIAAQAPNKTTLHDFWRMLWEKECGQIIMVTNLVETSKQKCEPYWSDTELKTVGSFTISVTEKEDRSDFVIRKLLVTQTQYGESKTFEQFHFISWPDHGVPNVHDFIQFMWRVRRTEAILPGPVLVHCSAGVGRTGTYIAIDILLDQMEKTNRIDVKKVLAKMRDQRKGMVQTKEQYECIFVTLLELSNHGKTSLSNVDFLQQYAQKKGSLILGKKTVDQLAQEVVALNGVPYTDHPEKLKVFVGGKQDVFGIVPPSKLLKHGYLLVPDSKGNEQLFWKLVLENDSYTIITLSSETEAELIPRLSQSISFGRTTITALRQASVSSEVTEKTLKVETKIQSEIEERQILHCGIHGWTSTLDSAILISCLTTVTEEIQKQQNTVRPHLVTVVYRESDAKRAITLCIANDVMTGMKMDREVEIFNNVRRFQALLPNAQLIKEDFTFFCDFAFVSLDASTMYANCP